MEQAERSQAREKRDFFRIDQDVHFECISVDNFTADNEKIDNAFNDSVSINLINELKKVDRDQQQTLKILADKNRLLGDYLRSMSKKIDTVARFVAFAQDESMKTRPKTRISLSEESIGFLSDRALYKGSYVAVRLVFLPNYSIVSTYAKVVRCEGVKEKYQVAAKFHRIPDRERQVISKQVLRAQVLRKKKELQDQ